MDCDFAVVKHAGKRLRTANHPVFPMPLDGAPLHKSVFADIGETMKRADE